MDPQQQQLIQQIEQAQSVDDLNTIWKNLAMDDDRVFKFLEKYANMESWAPSTIPNIESNAKRFCLYLRKTPNSGGIKDPKPQDVFDFIGSRRSREDSTKPVNFGSAQAMLSQLKPFFEFLNDVGIYKNNIARDLNTENLRRMYGEGNNQNNPQPDQV